MSNLSKDPCGGSTSTKTCAGFFPDGVDNVDFFSSLNDDVLKPSSDKTSEIFQKLIEPIKKELQELIDGNYLTQDGYSQALIALMASALAESSQLSLAFPKLQIELMTMKDSLMEKKAEVAARIRKEYGFCCHFDKHGHLILGDDMGDGTIDFERKKAFADVALTLANTDLVIEQMLGFKTNFKSSAFNTLVSFYSTNLNALGIDIANGALGYNKTDTESINPRELYGDLIKDETATRESIFEKLECRAKQEINHKP